MAFVNGDLVGTYHTSDGQPLEGYVGFASSFGAFRAEAPTVETLDRQRLAGVVDPRSRGLTLEGDGLVQRRDLLNRPVSGFPLDPSGTLVVWVPGPSAEDLEYIEGEEEMAFERRSRAYAASTSTAEPQNPGGECSSGSLDRMPDGISCRGQSPGPADTSAHRVEMAGPTSRWRPTSDRPASTGCWVRSSAYWGAARTEPM